MIRSSLGSVVLVAAFLAGLGTAWAQTISFADAPLGSLPKDFVPALTGEGPQGRWEVVADDTAAGGKALAQLSADQTDHRFPLAVYEPTLPGDVEVRIRFKPVSGELDQAGGVAVRLVDAGNYYVSRANALKNNVRFYRVRAGRREQLASVDTLVTPNSWHTLTLRAEGDRFAVFFDARLLLTATDATFGSPGKVALWTKADSVTHFDRLEIKPLHTSGR